MKRPPTKISSVHIAIVAVMLVLLPFHAFLTVWGSSLIGHYTVLRLWKELLLALLVIGCAYGVLAHNGGARRLAASLGRRPFVMLIAAYLLLLSVAALVVYVRGRTTLQATAYGWLLDSRYLVFFMVIWWLSAHSEFITAHWRRWLLVPASVVVAVALLQYFVLPPDVLRHFGYGPGTIDTVATIDEKAGYQRVQSTLRGANPLGAYLVLILSACAVLLVSTWRRPAVLMLFVGGLAALGLTFSRSAWIGAAAALAVILWLSVGSGRVRQLLLLSGSVMVLVGVAVGYGLRNNDVFQNTVFHTDEHSRSVQSSNDQRLGAVHAGLRDIASSPLGSGPGTAGPASAYGGQPVRLAENYFIQIGQEIGILGVLLYLAITACVARELFIRRTAPLALILSASLLGITLINLLSHAWTDDTLAYIWWGLAGSAMTLPVMHANKPEKEYNKA